MHKDSFVSVIDKIKCTKSRFTTAYIAPWNTLPGPVSSCDVLVISIPSNVCTFQYRDYFSSIVVRMKLCFGSLEP